MYPHIYMPATYLSFSFIPGTLVNLRCHIQCCVTGFNVSNVWPAYVRDMSNPRLYISLPKILVLNVIANGYKEFVFFVFECSALIIRYSNSDMLFAVYCSSFCCHLTKSNQLLHLLYIFLSHNMIILVKTKGHIPGLMITVESIAKTQNNNACQVYQPTLLNLAMIESTVLYSNS